MSVRADAATLQLLQIFQQCDSVPLQILAFSSERQNFETDEMLFEEGYNGASAILILSGSVSLLRQNKIDSVVEEGTLLGESAMIANLAYGFSARARDTVTIARIHRALFLRVASEYPDFGQAVLQALSNKLEKSVRDFDSVRAHFIKARALSDI